MNTDDLREDMSPCCDVGVVPVDSYSSEGASLIRGFLPDARSVVVLVHHVTASLEWAWFPFAAERGGTTCAADLHAKSTIEAVERHLARDGCTSLILPYPGTCGISFKRLAARTAMGNIGDSFLFLHHAWGPWAHLRVLLTDALIDDERRTPGEICTQCGKCIEACPANSLSGGNHDQQGCGRAQEMLRDGLMIRADYRYKCEACARVCPAGEAPRPIIVRDGELCSAKIHE